MIRIIRERLLQGHRTLRYPLGGPPSLPDRFQGRPELDESKCPDGCRSCADACPTDAVTRDGEGLRLDLGRCLFCTECVNACPAEAIRFTQDYRLAERDRKHLVLRSGRHVRHAEPLDRKMRRLFGRSLKLRQVSAGGDNSAEAELNVLGSVVFDMSRFGIQFVASPRHADGLVVTGPVTQNMKLALRKAYDGVPPPKIVIAVGTCAISGGIFHGHREVHDGIDGIVPVDLYIPGDPPHPLTILDGLLRLLGRLEERSAAPAPSPQAACDPSPTSAEQ
jgi:Ni,Fe-hydrogenase III small subunit/NAD-dependent dihydropyrimidine dehydrogenase PreA subunit